MGKNKESKEVAVREKKKDGEEEKKKKLSWEEWLLQPGTFEKFRYFIMFQSVLMGVLVLFMQQNMPQHPQMLDDMDMKFNSDDMPNEPLKNVKTSL